MIKSRTYKPRPCVKCGDMIAVPKGPQQYCVPCATTCEVEGCTNAIRARGRCTSHYAPKFEVATYEPIDGKCGIEGCGRDLKQKGLCTLHHERLYHTGRVGDAKLRQASKVGVSCSIDGCDRPSVGRGYCSTHYARWRTQGSAGEAQFQIGRPGEGSVTPTGYRVFGRSGSVVYEHRDVMEKKLGRKLQKGENVHHRDGDKLNNDPSNLELWVTQQPSGQRVEDRVDAAIELLRAHPKIVTSKGIRLVNLESQEASDWFLKEEISVSASLMAAMGQGV